LKAITLRTSLREKDAYAIYFYINNFMGGIDPEEREMIQRDALEHVFFWFKVSKQ